MFESISSKFASFVFSDFGPASFLLAQENMEEVPASMVPGIPDGILAFLFLLALIGLAIFLGNTIAKSLRLPEYGGKLSLIIGCILVALLLIAGNNFAPKFGIDLRGGINMIGSLNLDAISGEDSTGFGNNQTTAADIIPNLLRRVDPSGTQEIMIRPLGTDKIEVTIPTNNKAEADAIWTRLVRTGKLQFLIVNEGAQFSKHKDAQTIATTMANQRNTSRRVGSVEKEFKGETKKMPVAKWFTLAREDDTGQKTVSFKSIPMGSMLLRDSRSGQLVNVPPLQSNDEDLAREEFTLWWEANLPGSPQVLLMEPEEESMRVTGEDLDPSQLQIGMDERGRDSINFGLNGDGSIKMRDFTWEHRPSSEGEYKMAIVLDDQVHTWPALQDMIQSSGRITGNFSRAEVDDLLINLRSGNIDVALNDNPISSQFIESSLGQELKEKGLYAIGASFILVLIFMIFYYRFAGIIAALALLLNLMFILALIMAIQQPLTLTGLAGLVLTVGMSVDANVLIFERIREELDKGAALRMAIRNGFDKATTTIVDANVTTLITAIVLYVIGTEQIKGFAVTLILGILMSMFTAIYCSRVVFDIWERKRWITALSMTRLFKRADINFINKRFVAGLLSVVLIGVGIAAMFGLQGKILHHDLRGGSTVRVVFNQELDSDAEKSRQMIQDALEDEGVEINEEVIEFSVAKLSSDEFPNRVFKIDSNLPSYDGEGAAPYEELDKLLQRVFNEKLELLNVKVGETRMENVDLAPAETETGMNWLNTPQMISMMSLRQPVVLLTSPYQDEQQPPLETQQPALGTQQPALETQQPALETQQPAMETEQLSLEPAEAAVETQGSDATDSDAMAAETTNNAQQNDFQSGNASGGTIGSLPEVATDLNFKFPVSGKELTTLVRAAAEANDFEVASDQIQISSPDGANDGSYNSVMSKDWTVKLNISNADDASQIFDNFSKSYNSKPYFPTISAVGGQIAKATQIQALVAIIASLLGIIAYVWIRFQNVAFGLAAVVALIHDVLIVLGAIAISHYVAGALGFLLIENFKISLPIVAALLTIIGYSLNDTIVVFDRIREVRGKRPELNAEIVNTSISQTLSRTILTSLTTFIVVFILYCFGGDAIHGFAFSLVIGVIAGTYSSIFVASPVLLWLMNSVGLNPGDPIPDLEPAKN